MAEKFDMATLQRWATLYSVAVSNFVICNAFRRFVNIYGINYFNSHLLYAYIQDKILREWKCNIDLDIRYNEICSIYCNTTRAKY